MKSEPWPLLTRPYIVLVILFVLALLIYSNSFTVPFLFDDTDNIVENIGIRTLGHYLDLAGTRSVGYLSFALNYYWGGFNVFGYHLVNLLVHVTNGFLVYWLVLLLSSPLAGEGRVGGEDRVAPWIALGAALLFVAHPIQTQAVTYIVQRFASLVTLFYLFTVVAYLKWRLGSAGMARLFWYAGALLSSVMAMKTKENSFTIPLMILFVEMIFFWPIKKKQWVALVPFFLTLVIIPLSLSVGIGGEEVFPRDTMEISRPDYLFTQFPVLITYLRLLFFPVGQNLDHHYPIYDSLGSPQVWGSLLVLFLLFGLSLYLLKRTRGPWKLISFGILWFFLTISIESSIIPIKDVIFEHRVYLPSVGYCLVVSLIGAWGWERWKSSRVWLGVLCFFMISGLALATYQRNSVWQNKMTLWQDVIQKSPNKARGYSNLGSVFETQGQLDEAAKNYQTALKLQPDYMQAHNNLGNIFVAQGHLDEAIKEYLAALALDPNVAQIHYDLGIAYAQKERIEEAIKEYKKALEIRPHYPKAHNNLGIIYATKGRHQEAIQAFEAALSYQPDYASARNNLGNVNLVQGNYSEAIKHYQEALRLNPNLEEARKNLKNAKRKQGESLSQ